MNNSMCRGATCAIAIVLASFTGLAQALDYQIHGFASQGLVFSEGNNVLGHSTSGSVDFNELGINGTVNLAPGLLLSAQGLIRNAGASESGDPRLDYALLDYQFLNGADFNAGATAGRVKNPIGLFNDTRDVIFTRPGILLPQSTYFDGQGFRSLLFASNGAQLYGGLTHGEHYTTMTVSRGLSTRFSDIEKRQLTGGQPLPADVEIDKFLVGRLQDEINGGQWRYALSYVSGTLEIAPNSDAPLSGSADIQIYILSARYNAERYSLTAEYNLTATKGYSTFSGPLDSKSDGIYFQADYRIAPQWSVMGRYDLAFSDRNDRGGREYAAQTGANRHSRFARDATLGLKWEIDAHWGIWGEAHLIDGTSTVPSLDNIDRERENHWSMYLMMVGYRF
jgi:hypothetical protein